MPGVQSVACLPGELTRSMLCWNGSDDGRKSRVAVHVSGRSYAAKRCEVSGKRVGADGV